MEQIMKNTPFYGLGILIFTICSSYLLFVFPFAIGMLPLKILRWIYPVEFPWVLFSSIIFGIILNLLLILMIIFLRMDLSNFFNYVKRYFSYTIFLIWIMSFVLSIILWIRSEIEYYRDPFPAIPIQSMILILFVWLLILCFVITFRKPNIGNKETLIKILENYKTEKKNNGIVISIVIPFYIFIHLFYHIITLYLQTIYPGRLIPLYMMKLKLNIWLMLEVGYQLLPFIIISCFIIWKRREFLFFIDLYVTIFRGDDNIFSPVEQFKPYIGKNRYLDERLRHLGLDINENTKNEHNDVSKLSNTSWLFYNLILVCIMLFLLWGQWGVFTILSIELLISSQIMRMIPDRKGNLFDI